jgi:hypothetical protein
LRRFFSKLTIQPFNIGYELIDRYLQRNMPFDDIVDDFATVSPKCDEISICVQVKHLTSPFLQNLDRLLCGFITPKASDQFVEVIWVAFSHCFHDET